MNGRRAKAVLAGAAVTVALVAPLAVEHSYAQGRGRGRAVAARQSAVKGRIPRTHQEPAYDRGYADGYERGMASGRRGERYDPVGNRDYSNGDRGYSNAYGSREAYKNNYRAGFRHGYEAGYRDATR